jgi:hypothetical protein
MGYDAGAGPKHSPSSSAIGPVIGPGRFRLASLLAIVLIRVRNNRAKGLGILFQSWLAPNRNLRLVPVPRASVRIRRPLKVAQKRRQGLLGDILELNGTRGSTGKLYLGGPA